MFSKIKNILRDKYPARLTARDVAKFIGPGLLVTVGFIDPGNWASNVAAGADFGYALLWMVTLSTVMLIVLQHNAAHLGIVTGLCMSEAATKFMRPLISRMILGSAVFAAVSTACAEILGAAIALNMLFKIPIKIGACITMAVVVILLFSNSYKRLEKIIIGFVSVIGISFMYELLLVDIDWKSALVGWSTVKVPTNSIPVIMSVLGAVVMPHNLFLHSEIIQSRQWNLSDEKIISHQLRYEFFDTMLSMIIGWAINSAMILLAAATFFMHKTHVHELAQAQSMLSPLLGSAAALVFALALLCAGLASSITAGVAGGSIFAGMFNEPYDIKDTHSRAGVLVTFTGAVVFIMFISNPFRGLIFSQILLSLQLPFTICLLIYLTSSKRIMGRHANPVLTKTALLIIAAIVILLNIVLFANLFI